MNGTEWMEVKAGTHWLNKMADELGKDAMTEIRELDAQDWTPAEIAVAIMDGAMPNDVTRSSLITVRVWPWEKRRILKSLKKSKLEDFVRQVMIEGAMKEEG